MNKYWLCTECAKVKFEALEFAPRCDSKKCRSVPLMVRCSRKVYQRLA